MSGKGRVFVIAVTTCAVETTDVPSVDSGLFCCLVLAAAAQGDVLPHRDRSPPDNGGEISFHGRMVSLYIFLSVILSFFLSLFLYVWDLLYVHYM